MRARLERDIHRCALRRFSCPPQGLDFGMRPAALLRPAARNHNAFLHDHRANCRIRPGVAEIAPAKGKRKAHEALVIWLFGRGDLLVHLRALAAGRPSSSPDSSSRAARKSLASRKLRYTDAKRT